MSDFKRVDREKIFHNKRFIQESPSKSKYYKALSYWYRDYISYVSTVSSISLLELGSGDESITQLIDNKNISISSIDISEEAIEKMQSKKIIGSKFYVMDAHNTDFDSSTFDLIVGRGILHHLDLKVAINEIKRLLKSNGRILFGEPLNCNIFINMYRFFTPAIRTADERPLSRKDIQFIYRNFPNLKIKYYGFLTLFFSIFDLDSPLLVHYLDNILLNKARLGKFLAWSVLIYSK